jgi:hypothetical protein
VWEAKHVSETITSAMQTVLDRVKEMGRPAVLPFEPSVIGYPVTDAAPQGQTSGRI